MKKFKMLALPVFVMLIVSVLCLTGVTYAWFQQGDDATIGAFDVEVVAADGLRISLDDVTYKSSFLNEEIMEAIYGKNYAKPVKKLNPASAANAVAVDENNNRKLSFFKADVGADGNLKDKTAASNDDQYQYFVKFTLYIENSGTVDKDIYLTDLNNNNQVNPSTVKDYVKGETDFTNQLVENVSDYRAALCTRVAFVNLGHTETLAERPSDPTNLISPSTPNPAKIWAPNHSYHVKDSVVQAKVTAQDYTDETNALTANGTTRQEVSDLTNTSGRVAFITVAANSKTKVDVYLWIEGQDIDCVNYASDSKLEVALKFYGVEHSN